MFSFESQSLDVFTLRNRPILMNLSRGIKTPTPPLYWSKNISPDLDDSQKWYIWPSDPWQFTDPRQNDMPVLYESYANEHFRLHDLTKISLCVRNSTPITAYIFLLLDIVSPQHLDRSLFAFVLYDIKSKRISNRHNCDVYIRSECRSCPADVATAAWPRTATHDYGRFYSYI